MLTGLPRLYRCRDLEELRSELEDDEYEETRKDTLEQMAVRGAVARRDLRDCTFRVAGRAGCLSHAHGRSKQPLSARLLRIFAASACPQEFDAQLKKMMDGDMTLVSSLGQVKLALEAAIKSAFQVRRVANLLRACTQTEPVCAAAAATRRRCHAHALWLLPAAPSV